MLTPGSARRVIRDKGSPLAPGRLLPAHVPLLAALAAPIAFAGGCDNTLDAGHTQSHGMLPVDERNPVILYQDDWSADWLGEYSVLLANSGGPPLAGIIITSSKLWPDLNANVMGWKGLVQDARSSGLKNIPDVTPSPNTVLTRPADGNINSTAPNHSPGGQLIVDLSRQLSTPSRPLVVACGTLLTDIADAYLIDHSVTDRVVVIASVGAFMTPNATMGMPNGDMDPWADWIVAQQFRHYIQVTGHYDQTTDITPDDLSSLATNPLITRIQGKQPKLLPAPPATDQVSILVMALARFPVAVQSASANLAVAFDTTQGPPLVPDANGNILLVTQVAGPVARARFWDMLSSAQTWKN